ncbi:MAG: phosphate ABC transporter substrate-binding protein, partial [Alphaproteobacteria bacterium]
FTTAVAEEFGRGSQFKAPIVESTGTGGGLKLFCAGAGLDTPDIANASRKIKDSEIALCRDNGVTAITEIKIGFDGIVIANDKSAPAFDLSLRDIYLALAKKVPAPGSAGEKRIANPYKTWNDVNPALPKQRIEVLGPPPTSGTRDAFSELAMEAGCATFPALAALKKTDKKAFQAACVTLREDGAYIEAGENDNLIVQKLRANPTALGIFGYSFLEENMASLRGNKVAGHMPTFEAIASGDYPISRALYIYVKNQHVGAVPGLKEFLGEFTHENTWGEDGYLADRGLIPLPAAERKKYAAIAQDLQPMSTAAR